ncbi:hypothetical protein YC2023_102272 [Brassica napus]
MKRPLTTSPSSSSSTSSSACILPTQSETPRPKRAKRAKKSSLPSDVKPQNPTSPASTRRSSIYRGVTRHRWTGRYEAHLWDKSSWNSIQNKKGKQEFDLVKRMNEWNLNCSDAVIAGAYDSEEAAAHTYDLAALKYWGPNTILNFPVETYTKELEEMQRCTKEEYLASLRRQSSGFSRGVSKYRGVARHHHNGRWEARIGRVFGNKYLYLGTYNTQEEAAAAYDMAAIEYRGANAVTNFDISNYIDRLKKKGVFPFPVSQANHQEAVLAEAKQEVEAKEEPTEEAKQCVEKEEPQEAKEEKTEKKQQQEVEEAVVTCCIDSSESNELAWDFCMMDSGFAPFLTDSNLSSENPIEYPELFNEMGFEDNIDFMFEEGKQDCLSLENLDCCDGGVVVGRESPTSLSSSPLSCLSTDSASSTTTTTTVTSVSSPLGFFRSGFDMQVFQIWKNSETTYLLVVWTSWKSSDKVVWTSRKSSGLPGSRLDFSERFGKFLCLIFLHLIWKTSGTTYLLVVWKSSESRLDFIKVVWTSCKVVWKLSELLKSLLTKSSELSGSRLDFLEVIWTS